MKAVLYINALFFLSLYGHANGARLPLRDVKPSTNLPLERPAAVCNADNALRALRAPQRASVAKPFCQAYISTAAGLVDEFSELAVPSFMQKYPASRISSACSCLNLPVPPTTTTPAVSMTTSLVRTTETSIATGTAVATVTATPDPFVDEFYLRSTGQDAGYLKPIPWWEAAEADERNMVLTNNKAEATRFKFAEGNRLSFIDSIGHDPPIEVRALINPLRDNLVFFLTYLGSYGCFRVGGCYYLTWTLDSSNNLVPTNANGLNLLRLCPSTEPIENPPVIWKMFRVEDNDTGCEPLALTAEFV